MTDLDIEKARAHTEKMESWRKEFHAQYKGQRGCKAEREAWNVFRAKRIDMANDNTIEPHLVALRERLK